MTARGEAHARAGLLGNPSDGFFGKTLSVSVANFRARVTLVPSETLRIEASEDFRSIGELAEQVASHGYSGGARLMKAAIKRFADHAREHGVELVAGNFTVRYETDIPRQVGLGGSSALIAATLRALMAHYGVTLSLSELATLALEAETEELRIAAGLQDRVVQAYGGLVYMDFDRSTVEASGRGRYERLDPARLPRLYVAYRKELSKVSGHVLSELGARFARGDETVIRTLGEIAQLAQAGREALLRGAVPEFARLMDENFDLRRRIVPVSEENLALVEAGRRAGACAKFAGSGGSIVGVVEDDAMLVRLTEALGGIGATLIEVEVGREEVQA